MDLNVAFVEHWLVSHLQQLGSVNSIETMRFQEVDSFSKEKPLILSFENLHSFSAIGTVADFLYMVGHLNRLGRIIYLSSYCVYSPKDSPYRETDPMLPQNFIGARAKMLEDAIVYIAQRFETGLTILRLFNVYGAFQDDMYVVPTILKSAASGGQLQIGGSNKIRGFLHVNDLVQAMRIFLEKKEPDLAVYNVGSGIPISIHELIELACRVTSTHCYPVFDAHKVRSEMDYDYAVADITKIQNDTGWKWKISLEEGLSLTYQWILGRRGGNV